MGKLSEHTFSTFCNSPKVKTERNLLKKARGGGVKITSAKILNEQRVPTEEREIEADLVSPSSRNNLVERGEMDITLEAVKESELKSVTWI